METGDQYVFFFDISIGNISRGDVLTTMPFGNNVDLINLQGKYLRQALEHSVERYDRLNRAGAFLQVSGASSFTINGVKSICLSTRLISCVL